MDAKCDYIEWPSFVPLVQPAISHGDSYSVQLVVRVTRRYRGHLSYHRRVSMLAVIRSRTKKLNCLVSHSQEKGETEDGRSWATGRMWGRLPTVFDANNCFGCQDIMIYYDKCPHTFIHTNPFQVMRNERFQL